MTEEEQDRFIGHLAVILHEGFSDRAFTALVRARRMISASWGDSREDTKRKISEAVGNTR